VAIHEEDESGNMKLGDKVVIGGRTMLRPGFSLVGLTGLIVTSRYDAPAGTRAVWVDWEEGGYTDTEELPSVVNVPEIHLSPVGAAQPPPPAQPTQPPRQPPPVEDGEAPRFRLV
jgi:hypothetical protein